MNLLELRQQFVKLSGRYDLASTSVTAFDVDAGADFYINAGMNFIDRRFITAKTASSIFTELTINSWYTVFQNCASIQEVWCNDTESRWKLRKYPYRTIKENYSGLVSASDGGAPLYYSPIWLRSNGVTDFQSLGSFFNYVKSDDNGTYNGLLFTPKTDKAYNIEIIGSFYHERMTDNTDENYWTIMAPSLLLKASLYQLDLFSRLTKSAERWIKVIDIEGIELEKALINEESSEARVIE